MPIEETCTSNIDKDLKMPSQMSSINGTNNRYHLSKIMNYSLIESNNGADQFQSPEFAQLHPDYLSINNNIHGINMLEQSMAELCSFSVPITQSKTEIMEEYRMRVCSEDLGHQRPLSCMRRTNTMTSDLELGRPGSESQIQWSAESVDESRLRDYCARDAKQAGFIVGDELELVKSKSHRSVIQNTPDRIISSFKDRYGHSDSSSKKTYLQLGVRVPTKEHVSEIVGKQGSKIKQIREKTGALITTPGEQEDHVFIIEAPPRTALHVAQILKSRAEDITMSRTQENRRRSSCPINNNNRHINKSPANNGFSQTNSKVTLASGRIQVPKIIVGRIIGTQGSIITTIQRDTGTEIRSPPKEIGKPKHAMADFEILVYQTSNLSDGHEARQRVQNAKQLIAHVAMHQLEKIRAEEAPYSNYQVQSSNSMLNSNGEEISSEDDISRKMSCLLNDGSSYGMGSKEHLLTEQLRPFDWMWSDIEKLEDTLAHEVVDRILEESKKKTKTRSEPSIYENSANNLFTLGESDSYSNGSTENNRPRHSLPEARVKGIPGLGLDSFYRSNVPHSLAYSVNDNYLLADTDSDFRSSPSMSFLTRREPGSRSDLNELEILDFQIQDFVDNHNYNGSHLSSLRDISDQALLQYLNSGDLSGNTNRDFNRFVMEQNFRNGQSNNPYYSFPVDNNHWSYNCPPGHPPGRPDLTGPSGRPDLTGSHPSMKSYADSVKPTMSASFSTHHGTIGDHLKKTMSTNYKG